MLSANMFDVDRNSNTYANDALSQVSWQRYNDYKRRFTDLENEQIDYATDSSKPLEEGLEALGSVQGSFDRIAGQQQRRNQRQGLMMTPEQTQAAARSTAIAGGLAGVTAANRASQQTYDRQNQILTGARGSVGGLMGAAR